MLNVNTRHKQIAFIVLLAVLLRLMLMPFFLHMDLLSEYRRVNHAIDNFSFYPGFNRLVTFYIECIFYFFTHWFIVARDVLLYLPIAEHSSASTTHHIVFSGDPYVFRHLFLFKLPYLVFDLLTAILIWRYFDGHRLQRIALLLWLFNPVTLYATYVFGRFEVISLFFLVWTALCLKQEKLLLASLMFGLALNSREINLIFLPAFVMVLSAYWIERRASKATLILSTVTLILFLRAPALIEWLFNVEPAFTREQGPLEVSKGMSAFFAGNVGGLYPFFFVVSISYLLLLNRWKSFASDELFNAACLSTVLAFFISAFHSAHYFAWAIPFLILTLRQRPQILVATCILMLGWLGYGLLNPDGAHFTGLLATPLHESMFGLPTLLSRYQQYFLNHPMFDAQLVKGILLSVTSASMLVILYFVQRRDD